VLVLPGMASHQGIEKEMKHRYVSSFEDSLCTECGESERDHEHALAILDAAWLRGWIMGASVNTAGGDQAIAHLDAIEAAL
jgi:hypothetical protein